MCGISGFLTTRQTDELAGAAAKMAEAIASRGPDAAGVWTDSSAGIALSHRRLAILDLTSAGSQPMKSASGRYIIVFNGEIYNHNSLRGDLEHSSWRGHSDTETLLTCIEAWGLEETLRRSVGMFALALYDRQERTLALARDRLGEKPLYFGWQDGIFFFGSELKALRAHPDFKAEIDPEALASFMRHGHVPTPHSIHKGIEKLLPGTLVQVSRDAQTAVRKTYWSIRELAESGQRNAHTFIDSQATDHLEQLLQRSVREQLLADVPVGAFLSGGVDSSTVVALMQKASPRPVRTFTVGFEEAGYDESDYADAVASHLGCVHTCLKVTSQQALQAIKELPRIYDEPFADASQLPMLLVSRLARESVTVCLSGDGGDELFAGYNRHLWIPKIWRRIRFMPMPVRTAVARMLTTLPPQSWDAGLRALHSLFPGALQHATPGNKIHKLATVLESRSPEEIYTRLVSHWQDPLSVVRSTTEASTAFTDASNAASLPDLTQRMMYLDTISYLPDDVLAKVDRAAMSASLETRVPMLDHRLVEFALQLPLRMKVRGNTSKWLLRQVLYRHVPRRMIERPKMGFGVPIDSWLRGPLRKWADELLDPCALKADGLLKEGPIQAAWQQHLKGERNRATELWNVLMYRAWREQ